MNILRSLLSLLAAGLLAACGHSGGSAGNGTIGHVFIIVLENESYSSTFGAGASSGAPYLTSVLPTQGALLTQYHATGHVSLDNYITMVSGQSPNVMTSSDCQIFLDWVGTQSPDSNGQVTGTGCVYPAAIKTVANQLQDAGYSWRGYMGDMGNDLARDGSVDCSHPAVNSQDGTQSAEAADQYATRHDPFMYFHALIDDDANCKSHVVPLTQLPADLAFTGTTPNYVFITPNLCDDGHDTGCANGDPGGLTSIDTFLQTWVPLITNSPAFQQDGLLIVTFDEASPSDGSACCAEPTGPNTVVPGLIGPGGGRIGAVLISPLIRPGTVSDVPYNHYAMLRTVEDIFGLQHLGYAGQNGLVPFGSDIFNR
ncbi:MAG TPA: alkaline phosphatase family protein [Nevskiaceae bacterium]|nr:alkaline phosphatase family protein [Nevskiaceae bacterium]